MPTLPTRRLLPVLLSGAVLLLAGCASTPSAPVAVRIGPSSCFDTSCCAVPASLAFEPYRLYCQYMGEHAEGRHAEASTSLRAAIAAARSEPRRRLDSDAVLCFALNAAAQRPETSPADSQAHYDESLIKCQDSYGEHSDVAAQAMYDAASQRLDMGQAAQVKPQLERIVDLAQQNGNPGLEAAAVDGMGRHAGLTGDSEAERRLLLQAIDMKKAVHGEASRQVASSYTRLGHSFTRSGERAAAREWYLRAIGILIDKLGAGHPQTMDVMGEFANSHADDGNLKQAQVMFDMLLPQAIQTYGPRDERTVEIVNNLGSTLERQKRYSKALALFERALRVRRATLPNTVRHGTTALNAAKAKRALSGCGGARVYLRETQRVVKALQVAQSPDPRAPAFLLDAASFSKSCGLRAAAPVKKTAEPVKAVVDSARQPATPAAAIPAPVTSTQARR